MTKVPPFKIIARIRSDFPDKFGIPRQSGIVKDLEADIVFEPEYRSPEALRGLDGFSHIWLIWEFSENLRDGWSPTVRPPRLGGNKRMGVFATRSPFRPNPIGLSLVEITGIEANTENGPVIHVSGGDLMDGTPIFDIKPYNPLTECRPEARWGFISKTADYSLEVSIPDSLMEKVPGSKREALMGILSNDPRPQYHNDPERVYGLKFAGLEVKFSVMDRLLTVVSVEPDR